MDNTTGHLGINMAEDGRGYWGFMLNGAHPILCRTSTTCKADRFNTLTMKPQHREHLTRDVASLSRGALQTRRRRIFQEALGKQRIAYTCGVVHLLRTPCAVPQDLTLRASRTCKRSHPLAHNVFRDGPRSWRSILLSCDRESTSR
jgi:hypothetical protein